MEKNIMITKVTALMENVNEKKQRHIFDLVNDYLQCSEYEQGKFSAAIAETAASHQTKPDEFDVIINTPPKYRGKHEELVERIAQENRTESVMKMMEKARTAEKLRGR